MHYVLMIIRNDELPAPTPDELEAAWQSHEAFEAWCRDQGVGLVSAHALAPSAETRAVRRSGDDVTVTSGAVLDIKEVIAGLYVIDVPDLDQALAVAKRLPSSNRVEVRPVFPTGDAGPT